MSNLAELDQRLVAVVFAHRLAVEREVGGRAEPDRGAGRAADAELRNAGVQYSRELWSPQSKSAPGGMAIPNLFDQMFTRPAEDFFGQRRYRKLAAEFG